MTVSLTVLITIVVAVAAGVFALTKYANKERVANLEQQLASKDNSKKLVEVPVITKSSEYLAIIPADKIKNESQNPVIKDLAIRVSELEQERRSLILQLSEQAVASLDPRSEVSNLLEELTSKDEDISESAINTLFKIRDPITFNPLLEHFLSLQTSNKSRPIYPSSHDWLEFFVGVEKMAGFEIVVDSLGSNHSSVVSAAETFIELKVASVEDIDIIIPMLENFALTNGSSIARGTAKVYIQRLKTEKQRLIRAGDEKGKQTTIFGLLNEILKEVKNLKKESVN